MSDKSPLIFYFSAVIAIISTVGYHFFLKKLPNDIHPLVSVIFIYIIVLIISLIALLLVLPKTEIIQNIKKLNYVQPAIAIVILGMELGFMLMYRSGWDLSLGNIVTGVFINIILTVLGIFLLKEQLHSINIVGILLCITGVAMISYQPNHLT